MSEKATESKASRRIVWIYFLPALHLCACVIAMFGYVIPSLEYLGIGWTYILAADFPVSLVAVALAWKHGALATAWIVVVGTAWWCLLNRAAALVVRGVRSRIKLPSKPNP